MRLKIKEKLPFIKIKSTQIVLILKSKIWFVNQFKIFWYWILPKNDFNESFHKNQITSFLFLVIPNRTYDFGSRSTTSLGVCNFLSCYWHTVYIGTQYIHLLCWRLIYAEESNPKPWGGISAELPLGPNLVGRCL